MRADVEHLPVDRAEIGAITQAHNRIHDIVYIGETTALLPIAIDLDLNVLTLLSALKVKE